MNTTAAATQAGVAITTIRTWCRNGVVNAIKQAGRWIIDTASLARRITIGQLKRKAPMIDLSATYTVTYPGDNQPTVIAPKVRARVRNGEQITTVRDLAPLLAHKIDAIADEGNRLHTLTVLMSAIIAIRSEPCENQESGRIGHESYRDHGRLATTYAGTPDLPVDAVLDLAEQIREAI